MSGSPGPRLPRLRRPLPVLVALTVAGVLAAALGVHLLAERSESPSAAAKRFADAWSGDRLAQPPYAGITGQQVADAYGAVVAQLSAGSPQVRVQDVQHRGATAVARLLVRWALPGGPWEYPVAVHLARAHDRWRVQWTPAAIHPQLRAGDRLLLRHAQAPRAAVLGGDGRPLVSPRPVVHVGVEPRRAKEVAALSAALGKLLDVDAARLAVRIRAARPDAFMDVITLRQEDYLPLRSRLQALAGTVFRADTAPLAPTRAFARALLGSVGPVTAEGVQQSGGRYLAGDFAGLSGLQKQYDARLAGEPGLRVEAVHPVGIGVAAGPTVLFTRPPTPGQPVRVSLDEKVQRAADASLQGESRPSALVALRVSTGAVLAVANGPVGASTGNIAFTGRYPPGSSFKVVTTSALLQRGLRPHDVVPCPASATVEGRTFRNAEQESLGAVPFSTDFAKSCNTAFVGLSRRLTPDALPEAAAAFGLGRMWDPGVPVFSGSVPAADGAVDQAAAAIGQGRLLVSPVAMAAVAATVAHAGWQAPRLVLDPVPTPSATTLLAPLSAAALRALMREVVVTGTAPAANKVPGGAVYGKTGTAEYGTEVPPRAHAWFIGYQGDVAFAVLVEGGEFGGRTAAPIAARFLRSINSRSRP